MKLPEISIARPVLASMMNLALIVVGMVALFDLPVREVPDIDPPIVNVTTVYQGASASVVETEVTERIEEAVNGIEGIKRITSESREELSSITVEFELWRAVDIAAQDVRDRVSRVRGALSEDVEEPIIAKQEADARPVLWVALYSDRYSTLELTKIGENIFKDPLQTVKGVSSVILGGAKRYAIRIRLDSDRMAAHSITVLDIERALKEQNVELPSGRVENVDRELTIQTLGELKTPREFNQLVIRRSGSTLVKLQDVGFAEAGVENERSVARYNSRPAMGLGIVKQSKANTIAVAKGVMAELERMKFIVPEGVETFIAYDESTFVEQAIDEVWSTLGMAFIFVVLTIFIFLRNVRSTIIPTLTIPVSLIGTFALIGVMGYSINILTMLALVLAIGLVVDDSIVVLENIVRHIEEGKSPFEASYLAMKEISFAVVATTVALVAVFLPLAYQKSVTGQLFTEFAITLCGAVVISTFVALTLTPSISARILKPIRTVGIKPIGINPVETKDNDSVDSENNGFLARNTKRYLNILTYCLEHRGLVVFLSALVILASTVIYTQLEHEFLPDEDKGRLLTLAIAPEGATAEYTDRMVRQMEKIVQSYPEVAGYFSAVALAREGPGKASEGLMFVRFKDDRDRSVQDILDGPQGLRSRFFSEVAGAFAIAILPKSVGRGFNQSFQLQLQSNDLDALDKYAQQIVAKLQAAGDLQGVRSQFQFSKPEVRVSIQRDRAAALGISIEDIARTLQVLFGGRDLSTVKVDGEQYDVIVQLSRESRLTPGDLERVYVRNDVGKVIQLNNLVDYSVAAGPNSIFHFNRIRSAAIEGTPIGNIPLGTVINKVEAILAESLPPGFRYQWGGEAADLQESGSETLFVLLLAILTIYIVLAAQFESLIHPLTVMLAVPLAAIGAFGGLWMLALISNLGTSLYGWAHYSPNPPEIAGILSTLVPRIPAMTINIYSQIGIVLLLGLVTKNSILLVEFANQEMAKGKSAKDAMLRSALIRFRPILMTALGTITGILPIAIGFGAGAESRRPMGVAAVGGMLSATILTFFVIPVVYTLLDDFAAWISRSKAKEMKSSFLILVITIGSAIFLSTANTSVARAEGNEDRVSLTEEGEKFELSLETAINTALEHNPDIKRAKEEIEKQRAVVIEVRSFILPQINARSFYEQTDKGLIQTFNDSSFGTDRDWQAALELRQPLYHGGKSIYAYKQATLKEEAARLELEEVVLDIIFEVRRRYYDALLAESQLKVQEESVELLEEELQNEQNKFAAGEVSEFNVLRAEVELANSKAPLIRSRNSIVLSQEELKRVIGVPRDNPLRMNKKFILAGDLSHEPYSITLDDALELAMKQRPAIRRLKLLIEAAEQGVKVEWADYLPGLDAVGSYGIEKSRFTDQIDDTYEGWRALVEFNWAVFDSFNTAARVSKARHDAEIARTDFRKMVLDIEVEVRRAYSSLIESEALIKASGRSEDSAKESLRLARNRFNAGVGIQLDVLDARVSLTVSQSNRIQALRDYNVAIAQLLRVLAISTAQT